jgi:hypothetical protein
MFEHLPKDGIRMTLRWDDGVESTSSHIGGHYVAQYLMDLAELGDTFTIVSLEWAPWFSQFAPQRNLFDTVK